MPASSTLTYNQDPPHRAALAELGGGAKENSPLRPPDPVKHPTAEEYNQFSKQHEAANRVLPLFRLFVVFAAGVPSVSIVQALRDGAVPADFTVVDNAAGDTTIWWTTGTGGKYPAATGPGGLTITQDVAIDEARAFMTTVGSDPAVRVKTKNATVGTDANFSVEIY